MCVACTFCTQTNEQATDRLFHIIVITRGRKGFLPTTTTTTVRTGSKAVASMGLERLSSTKEKHEMSARGNVFFRTKTLSALLNWKEGAVGERLTYE